METNRINCRRVCILLLCLTMVAATFITQCEARKSMGLIKKDPKHARRSIINAIKKLKVMKRINGGDPSSNTGPYGVNSPFSLPPFDSLPPFPLPENAPPYCIYPPLTPEPPSTAIPAPTGGSTPIQGPPPSPPDSVPSPNPPEIVPTPFVFPSPQGPILSPPYNEPSPPGFIPSPPSSIPSPSGFVPSPPSSIPSPAGFIPSPPSFVPSPTGFVPSPPIFQPPVVYPPPTGPSPPSRGPSIALWCVAKPSVPDPIIQEAMNYACGSGADCDTILPTGSCFQPNTVYAHASYAFNSYWQRTKVAGGTCSFGGTAILVTVDPSHDGCHYMFY